MSTTSENSILTSLALTKAMGLARQRRWREAEAAITVEGQTPEDPLSLHALAAVVTSSGDHERALQLWEKLARLDPENTEAKRMISAIELWLSRPAWARYFPAIAGAVGIVIAMIVLYIVLAGSGGETPAPRTVTVVPTAPPAEVSPVEASPPSAPAPLVSFPTAKPAHKHPAH